MLHMQSINNLIRAEVLDHIDPDTCTTEDRMRVELEVIEALGKIVEARLKAQRKLMLDEGFATYVEHMRETAPGKTWWLEHDAERWLDVRRVSLVKSFKLL